MAQRHSRPSARRGRPNSGPSDSWTRSAATAVTTSARSVSSSENCRSVLRPVMYRRSMRNMARSLKAFSSRTRSSHPGRPASRRSRSSRSAASGVGAPRPAASRTTGKRFSCWTRRKSSQRKRLTPIIRASVSRTWGDSRSASTAVHCGRASSSRTNMWNWRSACPGSGESRSRWVNCLTRAVATRSSWMRSSSRIGRPATWVTQKVSMASPRSVPTSAHSMLMVKPARALLKANRNPGVSAERTVNRVQDEPGSLSTATATGSGPAGPAGRKTALTRSTTASRPFALAGRRQPRQRGQFLAKARPQGGVGVAQRPHLEEVEQQMSRRPRPGGRSSEGAPPHPAAFGPWRREMQGADLAADDIEAEGGEQSRDEGQGAEGVGRAYGDAPAAAAIRLDLERDIGRLPHGLGEVDILLAQRPLRVAGGVAQEARRAWRMAGRRSSIGIVIAGQSPFRAAFRNGRVPCTIPRRRPARPSRRRFRRASVSNRYHILPDGLIIVRRRKVSITRRPCKARRRSQGSRNTGRRTPCGRGRAGRNGCRIRPGAGPNSRTDFRLKNLQNIVEGRAPCPAGRLTPANSVCENAEAENLTVAMAGSFPAAFYFGSLSSLFTVFFRTDAALSIGLLAGFS